MKDQRGVVYVETLVGFLPVFLFFLGTIQITDLSVAHLVVQHASTTAARAAAVVLPDDGSYYEDRDNAHLHTFTGARRLDVERAADLILRANPRLELNGPNVSLDKATYADRDDLIATVTARYHCLIAALCGGGIDMGAESKLVYQGAKYVYDLQGRALDGVFDRARRDTERSIADDSDPHRGEHDGDPVYADSDSHHPDEADHGDTHRPTDPRGDRPPQGSRPDRTDRPHDEHARTDDPSRPRDRDPGTEDGAGRPRDTAGGDRTTPDSRNPPLVATGPSKPGDPSVRPGDPDHDQARSQRPGTDRTPGTPPALADNGRGQRGDTRPGEQVPATPGTSPGTSRDGEGSGTTRGPPVDLTKPQDGKPQQPVARAPTQKEIDEALRRAGGCFVAGTGVSTPTGERPIESIAAGDTVYAYDEAHRNVVAGKVARTFVRATTSIVDLSVRFDDRERDEVITGTANHPFYVPDADDYVAMVELAPGTELLTLDGRRARVVSLQIREGDFEVFNFAVEGEHNYFVLGSNDPPSGILVHNQTNPCGPQPPPNALGTDGLTSQQRGDYRTRIDNAEAAAQRADAEGNADDAARYRQLANDIRYERYAQGKQQTGKPALPRADWDPLNDQLNHNRERGRQAETEARDALASYLGTTLPNNNQGTTDTRNGTRPDSIGAGIVHEHKHFTSDGEQVVYNTDQMIKQRKLVPEDGRHVVTMSSDSPRLNGKPPSPRPSGPLAKDESRDIYYVSPAERDDNGTVTRPAQVTHKWTAATGRWERVSPPTRGVQGE